MVSDQMIDVSRIEAGEVKRSRRALEQAPDDKQAWKPHETSMEFGYLCDMVATIPTWLTMIVRLDELDVAPKDRKRSNGPKPKTSAEYLVAQEKSAAEARKALEGTT